MTQRESRIFSPRTVLILAAVAVFSMITSLLLVSFSNDQETYSTIRPNSFSISAIGHKAFVDSLKLQDKPVVVSQYHTAGRLAYGSVLLLLEPDRNFSRPELLEGLLQEKSVMLALPKRFGIQRDVTKMRWLSRAGVLDHKIPEDIIKMIDPAAEIYRPYDPKKPKEEKQKTESKSQNMDKGVAEIVEKPLDWTINQYGLTPDLLNPQLIKSDLITPLLATDEGILVGKLVGNRNMLLIISDPDLLSNFGLGRGDNAKIIFEILSYLNYGNGTYFIDETTHGFNRNPDIVRLAFQYPFIIITAQLLLFVILLIWTTVQRFGTPRPPAIQMKPGKAVLIQNTVDLLGAGNHKPEILMRYVELTLHAMARKLNVPRNLNERATILWLDEYGARRGVSLSFRVIKHRAEMNSRRGVKKTNNFMDVVYDKPLMQIALHLEKWKQEMLDGSGSDKINQ